MIWSEPFKRLLPKRIVELIDQRCTNREYICYIKSHDEAPDFEYQGKAKTRADFCINVCRKYDLDFELVLENTNELPQ
jgi:hypothetical protein